MDPNFSGDEFFIPFSGQAGTSRFEQMSSMNQSYNGREALHNALNLSMRGYAESASILEDEEMEAFEKDRRRVDAFKTALCDSYRKQKQCPFGKTCSFAHGIDELRTPQPRGRLHPKYKTVLCDKFSQTGYCKYGQRCQFIHKLKNQVLIEQRMRTGCGIDENVRPMDSLQYPHRLLDRTLPSNLSLFAPHPTNTFSSVKREDSPEDRTGAGSGSSSTTNSLFSPSATPFQPSPFRNFDLNMSLPAASFNHCFMSDPRQRPIKKPTFFPTIGKEFESYFASLSRGNQ